jgi:hypothetical protein
LVPEILEEEKFIMEWLGAIEREIEKGRWVKFSIPYTGEVTNTEMLPPAVFKGYGWSVLLTYPADR